MITILVRKFSTSDKKYRRKWVWHRDRPTHQAIGV